MAAGAPAAPGGAAPQPLRIMTWNVNGLASVCARRGLAAFLNRLEGADVVALQVWRWYSQQHAPTCCYAPCTRSMHMHMRFAPELAHDSWPLDLHP